MQSNEQGWLTAAARKQRVLGSPVLRWINDRVRVPLSLSAKRDRFFIRTLADLSPGSAILDLGCGSGRDYFTQRGNHVTGVDLCEGLLEQARSRYQRCVFRDIFEFLANDPQTYDCIVSSDVIGHIPVEQHENLYKEISDHLKPGGTTAHFIEVEHHSFWSNVALSLSPELFEQEFVHRVGHIALRPIEEHVAALVRARLTVLEIDVMASHILETGMINAMFGPAYKPIAPWWLRTLIGIDEMWQRHMFLKEAANILLNPLETLNTKLQPSNAHTTAIMISARKP